MPSREQREKVRMQKFITVGSLFQSSHTILQGQNFFAIITFIDPLFRAIGVSILFQRKLSGPQIDFSLDVYWLVPSHW